MYSKWRVSSSSLSVITLKIPAKYHLRICVSKPLWYGADYARVRKETMSRRKNKKRVAPDEDSARPMHRIAVLCPEPTLNLIREFSQVFRRSMRVTADDLVDMGRINMILWEDFNKLRGDKPDEPVPLLKIAWVSPEKRSYLEYWPAIHNMDQPLYRAFEDLIQLGAFAWHFTQLSKYGLGASALGEVARNLSPYGSATET